MKGHARHRKGVRALTATMLSISMVMSGIPTQALAESVDELTQEDASIENASSSEESTESAYFAKVRASSDDVSTSGLAAECAMNVIATAPEDTALPQHIRNLFVQSVSIMAFPEQTSEDSPIRQAFASLNDSASVTGVFSTIVRELGGNCIVVKSEVADEGWCMVEVDGLWYHVDPWSAAQELREDANGELSVESMAGKWLLAGDKEIISIDDLHSAWVIEDASAAIDGIAVAQDAYDWDSEVAVESIPESSEAIEEVADDEAVAIASSNLRLSAQSDDDPDAPSMDELLALRQTKGDGEVSAAEAIANAASDPCFSNGGNDAGTGADGNVVAPLLARATFHHDTSYLADIFSGSRELEYQSYRATVEEIPGWTTGYEYWEAFKSVEPETLFENFTRYGDPVGTVGFYETALLDMLVEVEDFDSMWREVQPAEASHAADGSSTTDKLIQLTKSLGKPEDGFEDIAIIDFSEEEQEAIIDIITNQSRYRAMKSHELGKVLIETSDTMGKLAKNVKKLETVANYSESMCQVLRIVAESSGGNNELRWACHDLRNKIYEGFDLNSAIAIDLGRVGVKELCGDLLGDTWDLTVEALGGDWKDLIGSKGLAALNRFVSTDRQYEAYRRMVVMDEIQPVLKSARDKVWQQYEANPSCENASLLGSMCDLLVGKTLVGCDYAKQYLDAVDEAILSQILRVAYGDLGPDGAIERVEKEKERVKREYRWANMLVDDLANQDEPGHLDDMEYVDVQVDTQEDFSHWASMAWDASAILGKQTMIKTQVFDVPSVAIGSETVLGPLEVYGDLTLLEGGSLNTRGNLLVRAADHDDGAGSTIWFGGILHLGYGNRVIVSGDTDIYALEMSDQKDALRTENNLYISSTDRPVAMTAGRVDVGGNIAFNSSENSYGFFPEQDCVLSFFGDGHHYVSLGGTFSDHLNVGRVELNDVEFECALRGAYIELASNAMLRPGSGISIDTLDLGGHCLLAPDVGVTADTLLGVDGECELNVLGLYIENGVQIPDGTSLTVSLDESNGGNGFWTSDISLGQDASLRVSGNRLVQFERSGKPSSLSLGRGSTVTIGSIATIYRPVFEENSVLSAGDRLEIYGPISMPYANSTIISKGRLTLNVGEQERELGGRIDAFGDVSISASSKKINLTRLFGEMGVIALRGESRQHIILSSYIIGCNLGNVGAWNTNVSWSARDTEFMNFKVVEGDMALATIEALPDQQLSGTEVKPNPSVTLLGKELKQNRDYTVEYSDNTKTGTASLTIKGSGSFKNSKSTTFKVVQGDKVDLSAAVITVPSQTYSGKALTPKPTVKIRALTLNEGTDYSLSYSNNTNAGNGKLTITGKGDYTGSKAATFTIAKAVSTIKLAAQSKTYSGKALAYSGKVTKTGSNGKVTYKYYSDAKCTKEVKAANVKAAKTYYVKATVAANANYKAATSAAVKFTVNKAANPIAVKSASKTVKLANVKKSAQTVAPITVSKAQGTKTFSVSKWTTAKAKSYFSVNKSNGKVTAKKGTPKGTYKFQVKVTAAGNANYKSGIKTVTATVVVK